jgi:hypothetical protein
LSCDFWMVKIPLPLREQVERVAPADRRKPSAMLRILVEDALRERNISNNIEVMKKADAT